MSVEVEPEEIRSESEYDSDVIVIGKRRKCPCVSRTPPKYMPSSMHTLLPPPGLPVLPRTIPRPVLLEWYPENPSHTLPCFT
jgi:hypothetical protein